MTTPVNPDSSRGDLLPSQTYDLITAPASRQRNFGANSASPDPVERAIWAVQNTLVTRPDVVFAAREITPSLLADEGLRVALAETTTPVTTHVLNTYGAPFQTQQAIIDLVSIPTDQGITFGDLLVLIQGYAQREHLAQSAAQRSSPAGLEFMRDLDDLMAAESLYPHKERLIDAVEAWVRYSFASARMILGTFRGSAETSPEQRFQQYKSAFIAAVQSALQPWMSQRLELETVESTVPQQYSFDELQVLVDSTNYAPLRDHIYRLLKQHTTPENPLTLSTFIEAILKPGMDPIDIPPDLRVDLRNIFGTTFRSNVWSSTAPSVDIKRPEGGYAKGYWLAVSPEELDTIVEKLRSGKRTAAPTSTRTQQMEVRDIFSGLEKWLQIITALEILTRPVTYGFIANFLATEPIPDADLPVMSKRVGGLMNIILNRNAEVKRIGSGNKIRVYAGDEAKNTHTISQVLSDFETDILQNRLDIHLRGLLGWLDAQRIGLIDDPAIPVRVKTTTKDDPEFMEHRKVTLLRSAILEPIYDLAMAIRTSAGDEIDSIIRPEGGYAQHSFEEDIPRRAAAMKALMQRHKLDITIGDDTYGADQIAVEDPVWRWIIRTFDIATRLGLNKHQYLETVNNSEIDREGDRVEGFFIRRYKLPKR
jgi:hypothetical protein